MGEELKKNDNIFEINFYSKEEAWEDMQANVSEEEKSLFQYIDGSPLPDTYRVRVSDVSKLSGTVSQIEQLASVEQVKSPNEFAHLLVNIRNVCTIIFTFITAALVIACFVIISNTTRTSVYARRREINIMRYVGASKSFIRIPFFVEGLVIGIIGSAAAFLMTWFAYTEIYQILTDYLRSWSFITTSGLIPFADIAPITGVGYLVCGVIISSFGTVISTRKHLNV